MFCWCCGASRSLFTSLPSASMFSEYRVLCAMPNFAFLSSSNSSRLSLHFWFCFSIAHFQEFIASFTAPPNCNMCSSTSFLLSSVILRRNSCVLPLAGKILHETFIAKQLYPVQFLRYVWPISGVYGLLALKQRCSQFHGQMKNISSNNCTIFMCLFRYNSAHCIMTTNFIFR